jgi:hypothetical protein
MEIKKTLRGLTTDARKAGREADGHTAKDDIGNAGDDARRGAADARDDARKGASRVGQDLRRGAENARARSRKTG